MNRSEVEEDLRSTAARDHVSGVASQHTPWWGPIAGSIGFLTVIPVPHVAISPTLSERSLALFPLVGAVIGALLGGFGIGSATSCRPDRSRPCSLPPEHSSRADCISTD